MRNGVAIDFAAHVQLGEWPGYIWVNKFGTNLDVGTVREDVWGAGGVMVHPDTADTLSLVSDDNLEDIPDGDGAQTVEVYGLDENWDLKIETYAMNGTTPTVTTGDQWRRVYRAHVDDVGVYGSNNTGNITITHTASGDTLGYIVAGIGQTQVTHFTVPRNYSFLVRHVFGNVQQSKSSATIRGWQRKRADVVSAPFTAKRVWGRFDGASGGFGKEYRYAQAFSEKTDIWFTAEANAAGSNPAVNVEYVGLLVRDTSLQSEV